MVSALTVAERVPSLRYGGSDLWRSIFSIEGPVSPRLVDVLVRLPINDRRSPIARLSKGRIRVEKWSTFATVAGSAAAGLTGLLFVAVSIRIGVIAKSQELRNRAAQTLALFVTVLFVAILLSIPDQSVRVLGSR